MVILAEKRRKVTSVRPKRYNTYLKLSSQEGNTREEQGFDFPEPSSSTTSATSNEAASSSIFPSASNDTSIDCAEILPQCKATEIEEPAAKNAVDQIQLADEIEKILNNIRAFGNQEDNEDLLAECQNDDDSIPDPFSEESEYDFDLEENSKAGDQENLDDVDTVEGSPIYAGHSMTVGVSMLLILIYSISHGISGSQLSDLLTLIGLHCMKIHPGLRSLFHFQKYFAELKSPVKKHYYCKFCLTLVSDSSKTCTNALCLRDITKENSKGYFLEISVTEQLKNLFNREGFIDAIKHRFSQVKRNKSNIEDIYDGELYMKLSSNNGPLSELYPYNVSFTMNTDGVPIFKSSKFSIWPVYLMINELPKKERKLTENMILCGLWFGEMKPFMPLFGKPLHETLKTLETSGIQIEINGRTEKCKGFLLCTTADLPARSLLLNMNQFNGAYSCQKCKLEGQTYRTGKGGSVRIFPYNGENITEHERDKLQSIQNAIRATESGEPVQGIKGPSFLMDLKAYDFVKGSCIDYMHGVLLGITKLLTSLWVSPKHSKETFSLATYSEVIDKRLLLIKPPSFISRVPRTLTCHFKYWKASELRSWLFYYSLPVLRNILIGSYYIHYAAFVESISLLCGNSISEDSIQKSQILLQYFVMVIPELYGERYMTLNMHGLLHLPQCVRDTGPLWVTSCFSFESANGELTKLFHGTQNVECQIVGSVNIIQNLPTLMKSIPEEYTGFAKRMHRFNPLKTRKLVGDMMERFFGSGYTKLLTTRLNEKLRDTFNIQSSELQFFNRMQFRGQMYHSKDYLRVKQRNSYTVKYFCPVSRIVKFGQILFFGQHKNLQSFVFISPFRRLKETLFDICGDAPNVLRVQVPHIHLVSPTNNTDVISVENLITVCVFIEIQDEGSHSYVCEPPNFTETD